METKNNEASFAETLKNQTDSFIDILKRQNDFFIESLQTNSNAAIELLSKIEAERNHYHDLLISAVKAPETASPAEATESKASEILVIETEKPGSYDSLVNQYLVGHSKKLFVELLEKHPERTLETLKYGIDFLPKDIDTLAVKHNFTDVLDVIKERKAKIDILKTEKSIDLNRTYTELCEDYREAFTKNRPTLIKRYIKQIYVMYPDQYEQFISANKESLPGNFNGVFNKIRKDLKEKPEKEESVEVKSTERKKPVRIDYKNIAIPALVEMAKNYKTNQRQFIQRCSWGLEKAKRSENDRISFLTQAKA